MKYGVILYIIYMYIKSHISHILYIQKYKILCIPHIYKIMYVYDI